VLVESRQAAEDIARHLGVLRNTQLLSVLWMLNRSCLGIKHQGQTGERPPSFFHTRAHLHIIFVFFGMIHFRLDVEE